MMMLMLKKKTSFHATNDVPGMAGREQWPTILDSLLSGKAADSLEAGIEYYDPIIRAVRRRKFLLFDEVFEYHALRILIVELMFPYLLLLSVVFENWSFRYTASRLRTFSSAWFLQFARA